MSRRPGRAHCATSARRRSFDATRSPSCSTASHRDHPQASARRVRRDPPVPLASVDGYVSGGPARRSRGRPQGAARGRLKRWLCSGCRSTLRPSPSSGQRGHGHVQQHAEAPRSVGVWRARTSRGVRTQLVGSPTTGAGAQHSISHDETNAMMWTPVPRLVRVGSVNWCGISKAHALGISGARWLRAWAIRARQISQAAPVGAAETCALARLTSASPMTRLLGPQVMFETRVRCSALGIGVEGTALERQAVRP